MHHLQRSRGVLGHQLWGQCPQAILHTPLLHQLQLVRGLKLRIKGEQAGAGASTPLGLSGAAHARLAISLLSFTSIFHVEKCGATTVFALMR